MRLPPLIGAARVMDMMLTARTLSAEEGQAIGLSQYLVDEGQGFAKGMELAHRIASNAAFTNFAVMHLLPRIAVGAAGHRHFRIVVGRHLLGCHSHEVRAAEDRHLVVNPSPRDRALERIVELIDARQS